MKTFKIEIPEGYEIDKDKSTFENIVFKEAKGLPKSWEELERVEGCFVQDDSRIAALDTLTGLSTRNIFCYREQAEASLALAQLSQLREVYRQGWFPDWKSAKQIKSCILLHRGDSISIVPFRYQSHFLSFQSEEIATQFLNNFSDLIEQARPLIS